VLYVATTFGGEQVISYEKQEVKWAETWMAS
jgi:hypothetical protein